MKEYPLTESDIEMLGLTKGGSTFFFSTGSLLLGYVINNLKADLSWEQMWQRLGSPLSAFAFGAAAVCFLVGGYLWRKNGSAIKRIKQEVRFDS